jgi:dephospho-CoA kinase
MAPTPQRRIGLTGGIASGKSTVGRLLAAQGLPVLDADGYAREALAPGSPGAEAVLARYGTLDRAALGRIVFADAAERQWLEQLVHPLVRARFAAELERLAAAPVVVLMIPLLFEAGLEELCSEVWLVDCDEAQQLAAADGAQRPQRRRGPGPDRRPVAPGAQTNPGGCGARQPRRAAAAGRAAGAGDARARTTDRWLRCNYIPAMKGREGEACANRQFPRPAPEQTPVGAGGANR